MSKRLKFFLGHLLISLVIAIFVMGFVLAGLAIRLLLEQRKTV